VRRVYVLGAGASASFSDKGISCPCVRDFFVCASKLGLIERYKSESMMSTLWRFLRIEFGVRKAELQDATINIEDVLTLLDKRIEEYENRGQYYVKGLKRRVQRGFNLLSTRFQLIAFIGHVLLEITNGRLCPLHKKLADQLTNDDTVITLNYDLLMDTALQSKGKWMQDTGYGIRFKSVIEGGKFVDVNSSAKSQIPYLKLHGSLNWLHGENPYNWMRIGSHLPLGQDIFLLRKIDHKISSEPIDILGKYEYEENDLYYDLVSLLIAPRADKPYGSFPEAFNVLWDIAKSAIETAEEIIIIGYSIPISDTRCQQLIGNATNNGRKPAFIIVNRSPSAIEGRLRRIIGYSASSVYGSFEEYLQKVS